MRRHLLHLGCLVSLLLSLVALAAPVSAQEKEVVVERRDGEITVRQNGEVHVVETWQVRFVGGPFQFAFRAIPLTRLDDIVG